MSRPKYSDIDIRKGIKELNRLRIKHGLLNVDQVRKCLPRRPGDRMYTREWVYHHFPVAPVMIGHDLYWRAAAIQRFLANLPSKW